MKTQRTAARLILLLASQYCLVAAAPSSKKVEIQHNEELKQNLRIHLERSIIEDAIMAALEAFREIMISGLPELGIPVLDPFIISELHVTMDNSLFESVTDLWNVTILHMSTFNVTQLDVNMLDMSLDIGLFLDFTDIDGVYNIDGTIMQILPLYGTGPFWIDIYRLLTTGHGGVYWTQEGILQIKDLNADYQYKEMEANFEGILGGGDLGDEINELINILGDEVIAAIYPVIQDKLWGSIENYINKVLADLQSRDQPLLKSEQVKKIVEEREGNANEYMDLILENVRQVMLENNLDPLILPDYCYVFNESLIGIPLVAEACLDNGWLGGTSNLLRKGEAHLEVEDPWMTLYATLGLDFLQGSYDAHAYFLGLGPDGTASYTITSSTFFFRARMHLDTLDIVLDEYYITDVGDIDVNIDGFGLLDWILNPLSELVVWLLKGVLTNLVEDVLRSVIEYVLDNINDMTP